MSHDYRNDQRLTLFERYILERLERVANALERGNELSEQAMSQRGSMDPTLKATADAARELINRPVPTGLPAFVLVQVDSENGMCSLTGESCTEDCGIGNPCKRAAGAGRVPS